MSAKHSPLLLGQLSLRIALFFAREPEEELTAEMVAAKVSCSRPTAHSALRAGVEEGWLTSRREGAYATVYALTPEALPVFSRPLSGEFPFKDEGL